MRKAVVSRPAASGPASIMPPPSVRGTMTVWQGGGGGLGVQSAMTAFPGWQAPCILADVCVK